MPDQCPNPETRATLAESENTAQLERFSMTDLDGGAHMDLLNETTLKAWYLVTFTDAPPPNQVL